MEKPLRSIFFVVPYPTHSIPGQRFRFELFLKALIKEGISYKISPFVSKRFYKIVFQKGHFIQKVGFTLLGYGKRLGDLFRARSFDIIFIYRETTPFRTIFFEWWCKKVWKKKIVYDFDDAIFLPAISDSNRVVSILKNSQKVFKTIQMSDIVFVGNQYLASHARAFNDRIEILPTIIDTNAYAQQKKNLTENRQLCLGWSGSFSTISYFLDTIPLIQKIHSSSSHKFRVKIIGKAGIRIPGIEVKSIAWQRDTEVSDLCEMDIGIMPLKDDPWSWGKCGLKILQYMALGIPPVASNVGVNKDIVIDGVNGFLAQTDEEWFQKIQTLLEDQDLRNHMGKMARKTIEENYSLKKYTSYFISQLRGLFHKPQMTP